MKIYGIPRVTDSGFDASRVRGRVREGEGVEIRGMREEGWRRGVGEHGG